MTHDVDNDPYLWLEDVTGAEALAWVRNRNAEALDRFAGTGRFGLLRNGILQVLDSDEKIPYVNRRGEYRYNFWRDATNPKGLWRRTTLEEYRKDQPEWDVLLDLDKLAEDEGENWVWAGAQVLRPEYRHTLIQLSRGGADATVVREFDLETRTFVTENAFTLAEAKTMVDWIDVDTLFVGSDFGPGTLTASGYPRTTRLWRRGTKIADAELIFEGKAEDVGVWTFHDDTVGFERDFIQRMVDFYTSELYLRSENGELTKIDVPDDATASTHREWLLIDLRSDWTVGDTTHPSGSLLATKLASFIDGDRTLQRLFTPDEHTSLAGHSWTRNHLFLNKLHDVTSQLSVLTPGENGWTEEPLAGVPPMSTATVGGTDSDLDDEYELHVQSFVRPATFALGRIGDGPAEVLKQLPEFFDVEGLDVSQHFATSDDGTKIPYFQVTPPGAQPEGGWPTLLDGYGGFEVPREPTYSGSDGRSWLIRGGAYVLANIRGGGEYGPAWHEAGRGHNRHKVFEDFAAVARDLVTRGVTVAARLGIEGGSNGGLLTTVMLTRYPELFGAVVSQVPLTDMRRYSKLLAGASWVAEYGDPDDPEDWAYLATYSPYHQASADRSYPPILLTTSTRDDRVHPGHARKLAARLRELGHEVHYYENIEGGHGGAADNKQSAFMNALAFEFLWQKLGGS
ncbi:prolyl oligopeptidase family serine peptidase [Tenggerimyces flavus]|uniref:Prolyl oligopeptidase family protein n=1 Tax=Tenggerimyces flavus TaxID=1708749 RepID=A0ABV7YNB3_9ACTN|nr:prolyl oligopeptidase family serine peptidase [Tenggerimyces flavus]MBM7790388.1 prolyl oligopeptidase [Tenggerimyces flavus]